MSSPMHKGIQQYILMRNGLHNLTPEEMDYLEARYPFQALMDATGGRWPRAAIVEVIPAKASNG